MNLEYLKSGARQFAYQLRKFFAEDEIPINHYVCKKHVVVLSTKKMYIYYYEKYIDYIGDYFESIEVVFDESSGCVVRVKGKTFHLEFEHEKDNATFKKYYLKYKD